MRCPKKDFAAHPFRSASEQLLEKVLLLRLEGYGWCRGVILELVPNRTRKIGGVQVNFIAKFDVDEVSTDLVLEAKDYDTSFSADYESWMLLEPNEQPESRSRWNSEFVLYSVDKAVCVE